MRAVGILLCALALIGAAAASSNGRELLANDKLPISSKDLPACPPNLPVTETGVPGLKPMINVRTKLNGPSTRNFTCFGGVPKTYSEYFAGLSQVEGLWSGTLYYDSNGFPTFDLTFQDPYEDYFKTNRKVVTFKEFTEIPSPIPGAAPWARYKVMSDTGSPPFSYVERRDTVGGAAPTECKGGDSENVNYEANYNFYMCNEGAPAPVAPIVPTVPVMPSPALAPPMVPVAAAPVPSAAATPVPAIAPAPVAEVPAVAPTTPQPVVTSPSPSSVSPSPVVPVVVSSGTYKSTMGAFFATLACVMFAMLA